MAVGIFVDCEQSIRNKAQYTFEHIFTVLGIPYRVLSDGNDIDGTNDDLYIFYTTKNLPVRLGSIHKRRCIINIYCCISNDESSCWQHQLPAIDYISQNDVDKLPVFYDHIQLETRNSVVSYKCSSNGNTAIQVREDGNGMLIDIGFDIIMSAFFLLSRMEERISTERDTHDRFSAIQSFAFVNEFLQYPVTDEYMRINYKLLNIGYAWSGITLETAPFWPNDNEFAVCLTHDVDVVNKWKLRLILSQCLQSARLVIKPEFKEATRIMIKMVKSIVRSLDRWRNFKDIINSEELYNFKSSFYFCGSGSSYGVDYSRRNNTIRDIIRSIHSYGWKIGMHGSYNSYNNKGMLLDEKKALEAALGKDIKGVRQHYLRFDTSQTWYIQSGVGLMYDVTLGYADQIGFRDGTAFPLYPYSLTEDKRLPIIEIPLAVMDTTLFEYMKDSPQQAWLHTKNILDTVRKYNGVCVLLWHQYALDNDVPPHRGEVYPMLLNYLSQQNAWVKSGVEVAEWWISRKNRVMRKAE